MGPKNSKRPSAYFNGMIAPIAPFALAGVLWYQGENDATIPPRDGADAVRASYYAEQMKELIISWRKLWAEKSGLNTLGEFPFLMAQLPCFQSTTGDWPVLREQQMRVTEMVPRTGIICLIDLGNPKDIHDSNKTPVGERFARLARVLEKGEQVRAVEPSFRSARFEGDRIILDFDNAGGGLVAADGKALRNFEIAGRDQRFVAAEATIEGSRIKVTGVSEPVAVRYAWKNCPESVNFRSSEGLPVFPFFCDKRRQRHFIQLGEGKLNGF